MPRGIPRQLAFAIMLIVVMVASGGCVLSGNGANPGPTPISQNLPTITPTFTDLPTLEPLIEVVTATLDPFTVLDDPTQEPTLVAQVDEPTIDPLILEITVTVAAATQAALDLTATAEAPFVIPPDTPTLDPTFEVPTAEPTTQIGTGADCIHTVSAGQNLFRIGLQYGVPYQDIATYNGIANANLISIGQEIRIPNCGGGGTGGTGTTESGTVGSGTVPTSSGCGSTITVEQGDTLFAISLRCNVLIRDIMAMNGITNPDLIFFNQSLRLQ